jgi:hypothetical protein
VDSYGEIGSAILLKLLSNPSIQKMVPGLDVLGGIFQSTQDSTLQNSSQNEAATFSRTEETKGKNEITDNSLSERDQNYLQFLKDISECLDEQQIESMVSIIHLLTHNPVALKSTAKHIQNFLNNKPKT